MLDIGGDLIFFICNLLLMQGLNQLNIICTQVLTCSSILPPPPGGIFLLEKSSINNIIKITDNEIYFQMLKITDRNLTILHKIFVLLSLFALGVALYDFIKGNTDTFQIHNFITFIIIAFIFKFYYVIMYCCKKIDTINTEERARQLRTGEIHDK